MIANAGLHGRLRGVEAGAAEEGLEIAVRRERCRRIESRDAAGKALRGIAAIGGAAVVVIFVGQLDLGEVVGLQRNGRVDAVAFEMVEVAERIAALVEHVQPGGDVLIDGLSCIECDAPVAPRARLPRRLVDAGAVRLLEGAVEHAAAGAAAEGQGARALQHLDALRVVQVAEILHVVTKAVDEEVGAGIDAADDELVAIAFALVDGDARDVARDIGQALIILVADLLLGDDGKRLRDVDDRRVRLGGDGGAVGKIADGAGARVLRWHEGLWRGSRLRPPCRLRPTGPPAARPAGGRSGIGSALCVRRGHGDGWNRHASRGRGLRKGLRTGEERS